MGDDDARERQQAQQIPPSEWIAAAIGFLLVTAVIGFMVLQALRHDAGPPVIQVRVESVQPVPGGYVVLLETRNAGDNTGADVEIEGTLRDGAATVETARMHLAYVPAHSLRHGGMFFTRDPRGLSLTVRPLGYAAP